MHVEDVGVVISWIELRDWLEHLPPTGGSALFRARRPHDWWYDWPVRIAAYQLLALQGANWQRGGGKSTRPTLLAPSYPHAERTRRRNVIPIDRIKDRLAHARAAARARQSG